MSLLTPLYIAGLLAVSLPVLFHLIRRKPRGKLPFSSLMFLSASPPRLTRKSRIDHLLLLLLRACALALLAFAFARPFIRGAASLELGETGGRRIAVLVDVSASMRRGTLWQQARDRINEAMEGLRPADDVALYAFDTKLSVKVPFSGTVSLDVNGLKSRIAGALESLTPSWAASDLGSALVAVADELNSLEDRKGAAADALRQIIIVSDFQEGNSLDALMTYEWPKDVRVSIKPVAAEEATNAGLHPVMRADDAWKRDPHPTLPVRISNDQESLKDSFKLHWTGGDGKPMAGDGFDVYVPAGESRLVHVPYPGMDAIISGLVLMGDAFDYDNTLYLAPARQDKVRVLYFGDEDKDDPAGMFYYLSRAFPETSRRLVTITQVKSGDAVAADVLTGTHLVISSGGLSDEQVSQVKEYTEKGGAVFFALSGASRDGPVGRIAGVPGFSFEDATPDGYAMLGDIDFLHPVFAVFSAPRFNDFTKVHFWQYRRMHLPDDAGVKVLARFDSGDPALFSRRVGRGRCLVLASSWSPEDSQLARSTKFIPLLSSILEWSGVASELPSQYKVREAVVLMSPGRQPETVTVIKPDDGRVTLQKGMNIFSGTEAPGLYAIQLPSGEEQVFAVNIAPSETRTKPVGMEALEQLGLPLGERAAAPPEPEAARRRTRDKELEGRQKLWRWLIVLASVFLLAETLLGGYLARARKIDVDSEVLP